MTDKQSFIDKLTAALKVRGVSAVDMQPYIDRFDKFYDRMASESGQTSSALDDIETIADNITAQIELQNEEITRLAEQTMTMDRVALDDDDDMIAAGDDQPTELVDIVGDDAVVYDDPEATMLTDVLDSDRLYGDDAPTVLTDAVDADVLYDDDAPTALADAVSEEDLYEDEYELVEEESFESLIPAEELALADMDAHMPLPETPTRLPDYVEEEPAPNSKMFWILFAVSLPVTLPLALIGLLAFGVLFGAVFGLIAAMVATLVAVIAGGAVLSLIGIIYGITQLFSNVPAGVYEIGLGVVIAGAAMFLAILIYNAAIRYAPRLIPLVCKLFKLALGKLRRLFNFLKRECAKL